MPTETVNTITDVDSSTRFNFVSKPPLLIIKFSSTLVATQLPLLYPLADSLQPLPMFAGM